MILKPNASRKICWMSSSQGDQETLREFDRQMAEFYSHIDKRSGYQAMLNTQEDTDPSLESVRHLMPAYLVNLAPTSVLEVGCADGRLYRQLRRYGLQGSYSGVEVASYLIDHNRQSHPESEWACATAYDLPFPDENFDVCFSLYVLEHLVYPEKGLIEMLRVVKPNGKLIIVFPDFVAGEILSSQQIGLSPSGRISQKIRAGKLIDAALSFYDGRYRLPRALRNIAKFQPFPVNIQPLCLTYPSVMAADVDAIYIASKQEIESWAVEKGYRVDYPQGKAGEFYFQAFMVIQKT